MYEKASAISFLNFSLDTEIKCYISAEMEIAVELTNLVPSNNLALQKVSMALSYWQS